MEKENQKPLTLEQFIEYNEKVLIPELEDKFVTKKEFNEFKDKIYTDVDGLSKKLDILLTEKEVREYQDKKQKQLLAIMIKALKEHQILSSEELEQIARLDIF